MTIFGSSLKRVLNYFKLDNDLIERAPEDLTTIIVGRCSPWHWFVMSALFGVLLFNGVNMFTSLFISSPPVNYHCAGDKVSNAKGKYCNFPNGTRCKEFEFSSEFGYTAIERWLLVCEYEYWALIMDTSFRIGLIICYPISGYLADRYGRKKVFLIGIAIQPLCGILEVSSSKFALYVVARFMFALSMGGTSLMAAVIATEIISNKWRTIALGIVYCPFLLAIIVTPFIMRLVKNDTKIALFLSLPQVLIFFFGIIYDTPCWLLMNNDLRKAESVLYGASSVIRKYATPMFRIRPTKVIHDDVKPVVLFYHTLTYSLTRWPIAALLVNWLILYFCLSTSMVLIYAEERDVSTTTAYMGVSSVASLIFAIGMCHVLQHRAMLNLYALFGNVSILAVLILSEKGKLDDDVLFGLKFAAWFCYVGAVSILWNVTSRMFSTLLRGQGTGVCLSLSQIGFHLGRLLFEHLQWAFSVTYCLLALFIVTCTVSSFFIFSVHRREFPDELFDMGRFRHTCKPVRWSKIWQHSPTLDEVEVDVVDLDKNIAGRSDSTPGPSKNKKWGRMGF